MSIKWGEGRDLDYWTALKRGSVSAPERRAMMLLASISDERRFGFYAINGMFPAMGNVTKRVYLVRRWTTVLELVDGQPRTSWCIAARDRDIAPETDNVVAIKNLIEGSEMAFREIGNAFNPGYDPNRGQVRATPSFQNPYFGRIGIERKSEGGASKQEFMSHEKWVKFMKFKAEVWKEALESLARSWTEIPEKKSEQLPPTQFERMTYNIVGGTGTGCAITSNYWWGNTSTTAPQIFYGA